MIVLGSESPRRKEILENNQIEFKIQKTTYSEPIDKPINIKPTDFVKEMSRNKNIGIDNNEDIVCTFDTIVWLDGIIGKPKDEEDAYHTLQLLNNNKHIVYTGFTIRKHKIALSYVSRSVVVFKNLSDIELQDYLASHYVLDKAGSYAIQDGILVSNYTGEYENIMGLPIKKFKVYLNRFISRYGC